MDIVLGFDRGGVTTMGVADGWNREELLRFEVGIDMANEV